MSRKFLTNIDLNSNELRNGVIHNLATDPGTGVAGQLYFNTVLQTLKIYNGTTSQWEAVGSAEFTGTEAPMNMCSDWWGKVDDLQA